MSTIQELRQEIQDINFSKTLLDKQNYANDLVALRKDIEVLRRDMETTKAEITRINQDVRMLVQDKDEREVSQVTNLKYILLNTRFFSFFFNTNNNCQNNLKKKIHVKVKQQNISHSKKKKNPTRQWRVFCHMLIIKLLLLGDVICWKM